MEQIRDALDTGGDLALQGGIAGTAGAAELELSLGMRDLDLADDATLLDETDDSPRHSERSLALAVADCLLGLLHALPEPVVPFASYLRAIEAETRDRIYAVRRGMRSAGMPLIPPRSSPRCRASTRPR